MKTASNLFNFENSYALVIGGSSGLGKAIAEALLANGATLCIASIDTPEKLAETAQYFKEKYNKVVHTYFADITDEASIQTLNEKVAKDFDGKLNILVNSAGMIIRKSIDELTVMDWEKIHAVNALAPFRLAKSFFPLLKQGGWGRVINLASYFASHASKNRAAYAASKGDVLQFSKALAVEWASYGITANTISPGGILTEMTEHLLLNQDMRNSIIANVPVGRIGKPEDMMTAALFLASPSSSYVTGIDIIVDGGWAIQ